MSQLQNSDSPEFSKSATQARRSGVRLGPVRAVHLQAPPFFENVRVLIARSVAGEDAIFFPWGKGDAVFPLVAAGLKRYELVGETPTANGITSSE
jgi:hypothetical protein